eukprot:403341701
MQSYDQKKKGKQGRIFNTCMTQIRSIDRFGYPVSLTYKNNQTFTSGFGGCMTILSVFSLTIYFGVMLNDVIQRNRYVITESSYLRDLYNDQTDYKFNQNTFDFAYYLSYSGFNPAVTNLNQYFSVRFYSVETRLKKNYSIGEYPLTITYQDMNTTQCTNDRFNGEPNRIGSNMTGWFCPDFQTIYLQGKPSSLYSKKFRFEVTYCDTATLKKSYSSLECKSTQESDAIIQDFTVSVGLLEQYIDVGEFERSPLKSSIQTANFPLTNDTRYDWFFLSENYLKLKDSWLASTINEQNLNYTKFRNQLSTYQMRGAKKLFIQQSFLIDDLVKVTQRTTYNLIDALTATGGFASIIMILFRVLTGRIQKVLYFTSIMKKLFLYMDNKFKYQVANIVAVHELYGNSNSKNGNAQNQNITQTGKNGIPGLFQDPSKKGTSQLNGQNIKNNDDSKRVMLNQDSQYIQDFALNASLKGMSSKQLIRQRTIEIKNKLENLKYFNYSFTEYLGSKLKKLFSIFGMQNGKDIKETLYQIGVDKLSKEFDMVRYLKKIRIADSIAELTLSNFQRDLIPYFDRNILDLNQNHKFKTMKTMKSGNIDLTTSLKKIVRNSKKSIIDSKIIDNLGMISTGISFGVKQDNNYQNNINHNDIIQQETINSPKKRVNKKKASSKSTSRIQDKSLKLSKYKTSSQAQKIESNRATNHEDSPQKKDFNDTQKKLSSKSHIKENEKIEKSEDSQQIQLNQYQIKNFNDKSSHTIKKKKSKNIVQDSDQDISGGKSTSGKNGSSSQQEKGNKVKDWSPVVTSDAESEQSPKIQSNHNLRTKNKKNTNHQENHNYIVQDFE